MTTPISPPRAKGRENAKDTICRNLTIYGHCRYEGKGCSFNHDPPKAMQPNLGKLNGDSPAFSPASPKTTSAGLAVTNTPRNAGLSPKIASAAVFRPKPGGPSGGDSVKSLAQKPSYNPAAPDWNFTPGADIRNHGPNPALSSNGDNQSTYASTIYDPFSSNTSPSITQATHAPIPTANPYSQESGTTATSTYYQQQSYNQPPQYHLYTSLGPHKEALLPYQRSARDFFIPEDLREDLQRKSAAQLQTLQNTNLPQSVDYFHSLVPLDINNIKNVALFGYPTWLYKAVSTKDGHVYALRRIEGFRLANDRSIKAVQAWRRVNSGNIVSVVDSFTTRAFGDSSLIVVYDYFPLSKTLADTHLQGNMRGPAKTGAALLSEVILWSYIVQVANALKAIHASGLAARSLDASKIIITCKNRIRLSGCGILDALQLEGGKTLPELQREDLVLLGHLILNLASGTIVDDSRMAKALDTLGREKSPQLKERTTWLLNVANGSEATIDAFLSSISNHLVANFDAALHQDDILITNLSRELENSRIVRLMTKLNFITERPDFNMSPEWSETGERYPIKLFRDYVFHQVDAQNNPVLSLAHVISCLNKLDAASDEKIQLTSRDDQTVFIVSFKEMKRACESAFGDLVKASRKG